jgi:hypothetical protein
MDVRITSLAALALSLASPVCLNVSAIAITLDCTANVESE